MALTTRRQFVRRTATAAAALCGCPVTAFAGLRRTAEGTDQNVTPVETPAIRKLVSQIRGHVIVPESPDYDSSRLVFNRAFDRHPALIVRCANRECTRIDANKDINCSPGDCSPESFRGSGRRLILVFYSRQFVSIRGYFAPDDFCASFAQESLSVTVRLKTRCSDVLSLSRPK